MKNILSHKTTSVLGLFLIWKISLTVFLVLALYLLPLGSKDRFLGGGPQNYLLVPEVFAWANFDGEHYLAIANYGYKGLEQAFFPIYPLIIGFLSKTLSFLPIPALMLSTVIGLFISGLSFAIALFLLWDLIKIDYSGKIAFTTIAILLIFPTSFYFNALYTESIFLLFLTASLYLARKGMWFWASIFALLASATRVFGVLLLISLLIEAWQQKARIRDCFWIVLSPLGLLGYMLYLYLTVGDPVAFYSLQKAVGQQHQSGIVLLPQVFFRYIKILLVTERTNPIYQTIVLEFIVGILFFILPICGLFKKVRLSYLFFALAGFLLPTIQGSFSSLPRYVIVLLPSFLIMALFLEKVPKILRILLLLFSYLALGLETMLFLRAYWVA